MNAWQKLALVGAGIALTAAAAPAPNAKLWSGAWKLNMAKSKFSAANTAEKGETRTYTVSGNRLTMRSNSTTSAGKAMKWSYSAATDGKWYPTAGNPNTDHIALTLVSDREVKSNTQLHGKPSANATASVSADGKQLTIDRNILTAKGGPSHDVLVFDRAK